MHSRTQVQLLKSYFVLQAALSMPEIAALPIVKMQSIPVNWLQEQLSVGLFPDTEILYVQITVPTNSAEQGRKLVDAVVRAYMENVVNASKQRRGVTRDLLSRRLSNFEEELRRKMDDYFSIAKELQSADDDAGGQLLQQLDMRRLDRVESEIMRLEDEAAQVKTTGGNDKSKIAYYEDRLGKLRERQEELEKTLRSRSEKSTDLSTRKNELDQLRTLVRDIKLRLEMMDLNEENPEQETIRVIQPAVVTDAPAASEKSAR